MAIPRRGQIGQSVDPMPPLMRASLRLRQFTPCGIIFLGSSTTQGTNASQPYFQYTHLVTGMLQRAYPNGIAADETTIQNIASSPTKQTTAGVHGYYSGIGGTTSGNYLTTALVTTITAMAPAVRIHMSTTNDLRNGVNPATTQSNLQGWINQLRAAQTVPTIDILVQSYAPWDATYTYPATAYTTAMMNVASDPQNNGQVYFIDISDAYTQLGVPPTADGRNDILGLIDTDHIHQVDKGHAYMAEVFRERLGIPVENVPVVPLAVGTTPRNGETLPESIIVTRNA